VFSTPRLIIKRGVLQSLDAKSDRMCSPGGKLLINDDPSGSEAEQGADNSTWIDRLESGVISISRAFAMLAWGLLGFPVWVVMILVSLSFLLLLTFVRAFTARNFSLDRQLLRTVAGSYPNGFRYIRIEFEKIKKDIEDEEEPDVGTERSYVYSAAQTLLLLVIAIASYLTYKGVDVFKLSESAYAGALVVVAASLLMAWSADRRKERSSVLVNSAADKKSPTAGAANASS
jgi:hypothetical protein